MRRFIQRYTTDPIRGIGRMARGNVRQGLRDIAPAAQVAAMFVPGGQAASAGLGALAGALGQERGASAGDFARGAVGGASTAMAGRAAQQGIRGMFSAGAPQPMNSLAATQAQGGPALQSVPGLGSPATASMSGLPASLPSGAGAAAVPGMGSLTNFYMANLANAASSAAQATPSAVGSAAGNLGSSLRGLAGTVASGARSAGGTALGALGGAGRFATENAEILGPLIGGMFQSQEGRADRALKERELGVLESREERAEREAQEERERRERVARFLAPMFQDMLSRQAGRQAT